MKKLISLVVALAGLCALSPAEVIAQKASANFYVAPFYNSKGPSVKIGKFSKELASADKQSIKVTVATMKQEMAMLPAISMFVAAARLYDLGYRDESMYWFYAAQYRARLFQVLLEPSEVGGMGSTAFELKSAHNAFRQTLGEYVNGYAGCDQAKWIAVLSQIQAENATTPEFSKIYPSVKFIPSDEWGGKNSEINSGLTEMSGYLKTHWAELQAARKESGQDKKFCNR
jgi:hypothetical protein